tara:strand:- start:4216 stop:4569 length:354 start_codon:yes stop_codon:yes gene_type:complete
MKDQKLGKFVSVSGELVEHIKNHNIHMSMEQILRTIDKRSNGKEGLHILCRAGNNLTIVIRGKTKINDKEYGIVRTIWQGDNESKNERTGLPIIRYKQKCKRSVEPYVSDNGCELCN